MGLAIPWSCHGVAVSELIEWVSKGQTRFMMLGRVFKASLWFWLGLRLVSKSSDSELVGGRLAVKVCDE